MALRMSSALRPDRREALYDFISSSLASSSCASNFEDKDITIKTMKWHFGPVKLLQVFLFFGLSPSFLEGGPGYMGEEGVNR